MGIVRGEQRRERRPAVRRSADDQPGSPAVDVVRVARGIHHAEIQREEVRRKGQRRDERAVGGAREHRQRVGQLIVMRPAKGCAFNPAGRAYRPTSTSRAALAIPGDGMISNRQPSTGHRPRRREGEPTRRGAPGDSGRGHSTTLAVATSTRPAAMLVDRATTAASSRRDGRDANGRRGPTPRAARRSGLDAPPSSQPGAGRQRSWHAPRRPARGSRAPPLGTAAHRATCRATRVRADLDVGAVGVRRERVEAGVETGHEPAHREPRRKSRS